MELPTKAKEEIEVAMSNSNKKNRMWWNSWKTTDDEERLARRAYLKFVHTMGDGRDHGGMSPFLMRSPVAFKAFAIGFIMARRQYLKEGLVEIKGTSDSELVVGSKN